MKNLLPSSPKVIELSRNDDFITVFTPIEENHVNDIKGQIERLLMFSRGNTKRQVINDEFYKYHNFTLDDIVAIGDNSIESRFAASIIEHLNVKIQDVIKKNFKCFVFPDWKTIGQMNCPYHEDGKSSWNCLMEKLRHPQYGIIYKIKVEDIKHFKII